jgi:hypothetical protein
MVAAAEVGPGSVLPRIFSPDFRTAKASLFGLERDGHRQEGKREGENGKGSIPRSRPAFTITQAPDHTTWRTSRCRVSDAGTQHAAQDHTYMDADRLDYRTVPLSDAEDCSPLAASHCCCWPARLDGPSAARSWRRRPHPCCIAASGDAGRALVNGFTLPDNTKTALSGARGVHVRESIRLEGHQGRHETGRGDAPSHGFFSATVTHTHG